MTDFPQPSHPPMEWANAVSTRPSLEGAVKDVVEQLKGQLTAAPDLGLVFISSSFTSEFARLLPLLQDLLPIPVLVGCSGGGIVGMDAHGQPQELEDTPALSLTVARLPGVLLRSFHTLSGDLPDLDSPPAAWAELIGVAPEQNPHFILMADPFSSSVTDLLQGLDFAYPSGVKIGGLASVDGFNRHSGLFCDRTLYTEGMVGVALAGPVVLDTIVAQGCRPIGPVYRVDKAERNILLALGDPEDGDSSRPPLELLQAMFETLSDGDRKLAQSSLFIGIAQDSFKLSFDPGDFLIRTHGSTDVFMHGPGRRALRPGQLRLRAICPIPAGNTPRGFFLRRRNRPRGADHISARVYLGLCDLSPGLKQQVLNFELEFLLLNFPSSAFKTLPTAALTVPPPLALATASAH